ncbi:TolC family protein [Cytophaga aurantiaca]|uniref:TolC family protein n=1 Tax=Cytophaga aurantiaca TaxID=29530 RepID=UPI00035D3560|nr:TolC family protein [Cytophaga aurantiaca]
MKTNQIIIFISGLLLCASCMVGPKYKQPDINTSTKFSETFATTIPSDTAHPYEWFKLFNDSSLVDLIKVALDSNYDVRIATKRIEESRALYGMAKADLYPAFTYGAGYLHYNPSNNGAVPIGKTYDNFSANVGMSWELDFWGKIRHSKKQAYYQVLASEDSRKAIQLSIVSDVATMYFNLVDLDNKIAITKRTVDSRQKMFDIINDRFNYGDVAEIDKLQSEQQLEDVKAIVYQLERQVKNTERALCVLLAQTPRPIVRGKEIVDQVVNPYIPEGLPSELLSQRPDIRMSEKQLQAQYEKIGIAVAMRYPSFQITGLFGFMSSDASEIVSTGSITNYISTSLMGPLFNFGKNKRRVESEKMKMEQLALQYQKNYIQALVEVENELTNTRTMKEEMAHRKLQVEAARKVLELSKARYTSGYTDFIEVLNSEQTLFTAEISYSTLMKDYLKSYVNLYKAFGGGW